MSEDRPRCGCGIFVSYSADTFTPYGCADPEAPEPYDPEYLCRSCSFKEYKKLVLRFNEGYRGGDWIKSRAERRAARACGLVWSNGIGVLGSKTLWEDAHRYITSERYDQLKDLPYWGYCGVCGAKNANGYCSVESCEKSFLSKNPKLSTA